MSTGILIKNIGKAIIKDNAFHGFDSAINVENAQDLDIQSNYIISKEALVLYGDNFKGLVKEVIKSKDPVLKEALIKIITSRSADKEVNSWMIILKKLRSNLGGFSIDILKQVLSNAIYLALKTKLLKFGINLQ
ncbi:MAG: hypothetical protein ACOYUB_01070 [Patescibacteria group bacterium]